MKRKIQINLEEEILNELDKKRSKCGLSRGDYLKVLILKSTIEVEEIETEDVLGLDEIRKARRFKKVDEANYKRAMDEYKEKNKLWKYEDEKVFLKEVNRIYTLKKVERQIAELKGTLDIKLKL